MDKSISDQDFRLFIRVLKQVSEYDFSDYSEKSLKRLVAKVISDTKTDISAFVWMLPGFFYVTLYLNLFKNRLEWFEKLKLRKIKS